MHINDIGRIPFHSATLLIEIYLESCSRGIPTHSLLCKG